MRKVGSEGVEVYFLSRVGCISGVEVLESIYKISEGRKGDVKK